MSILRNWYIGFEKEDLPEFKDHNSYINHINKFIDYIEFEEKKVILL